MITTDAKVAAQEILEAYWASGLVPVDPVAIAVGMGVDVHEVTLPKNVSGALLKHEGDDPFILIEKADSKNRQRFTCAHELGHFYENQGKSAMSYIDYRGPLSANGSDSHEVFANKFAANLLMPEDKFKDIWQVAASHISVAKFFGVSAEAVSYRAQKLNLSK